LETRHRPHEIADDFTSIVRRVVVDAEDLDPVPRVILQSKGVKSVPDTVRAVLAGDDDRSKRKIDIVPYQLSPPP
jgi:hypothetical protein